VIGCAVGAALDQIVNMIAKLGFDDVGVFVTAIFNSIVKEGGYGLVL
jgi:hypothetical protein